MRIRITKDRSPVVIRARLITGIVDMDKANTRAGSRVSPCIFPFPFPVSEFSPRPFLSFSVYLAGTCHIASNIQYLCLFLAPFSKRGKGSRERTQALTCVFVAYLLAYSTPYIDTSHFTRYPNFWVYTISLFSSAVGYDHNGVFPHCPRVLWGDPG